MQTRHAVVGSKGRRPPGLILATAGICGGLTTITCFGSIDVNRFTATRRDSNCVLAVHRHHHLFSHQAIRPHTFFHRIVRVYPHFVHRYTSLPALPAMRPP